MYVVLFCFLERLEQADWGFKTPDLPPEHDAMRLRFQVYVTLWHFMGHGGKFSVFFSLPVMTILGVLLWKGVRKRIAGIVLQNELIKERAKWFVIWVGERNWKGS